LRETVSKKDEIPWDRLKQAIIDFGDIGVKAVTFSGGGEPLVYPNIKDAFALVLENGVDLSLITNGQLLTGEISELLQGAKWVRISMDSCDEKTFSRMRNIPEQAFKKLVQNIVDFAKVKNRGCEFGINFVINHDNAHQVFDMAKFVKNLGVNHIKYTARITKDLFDYHKGFKDQAVEQIHNAKDQLADDNFKVINKYEDDFNLCMVFERTYSRCSIMQIITVLAANSKVYLCHDKAYVTGGDLGDLSEMTFKEIWFSESTKRLFREFDAKKSCRHHCVYDERNVLINEAFKCADNNINFI